jgi:ABC-type branched-subunit amino acid transport system substrate-binding protein
VGWIIDLSGNGGSDMPYNDAFLSAIKAVNAAGGVHGHSIDLVTCDSASNLNTAASCGQQMVSDRVVAVVMQSGEDSMMPYLQNAGIPTMDDGGLPLYYRSPVSFITNDLSADVSGGYLALLAHAGCKSVSSILALPGQTSQSVAIYTAAQTAAAKRFGVNWKGNITVPSTAPDLAPFMDEAASKGAQCIESLAVGPQAISALKALDPLAQEGKFDKTIICTACLSIPGTASAETPLINALGKHILLLGASDPPNNTANPVVVRWVHDQSAYNSAKTPDLEAVSGTNWVNLQLVVRAANAVYPNVTSSNILHYLNNLNSFWPGLYPTESFSHPISNPYGPRDFGAWVANYGWTPNGQNLPRISPYVSVLNGAIDNNSIPAGFDVNANFE